MLNKIYATNFINMLISKILSKTSLLPICNGYEKGLYFRLDKNYYGF
ncbi:hypothetical protein J5U22_01554 [Saccharolobus shibatae]|uniref:Uncharacterized protein n=1 Tax=Saccharolobus shibatae TaxID=2286 RepID=A0A8F5C0W3_9CREN|nr:hypothetical protein J5U22_01554 [Saccharolobus shibatae]